MDHRACDPRGPGGIGGLPEGFSFHDLRHYLASLLIASGADVKTVQARMRHAAATCTPRTRHAADVRTGLYLGASLLPRKREPAWLIAKRVPVSRLTRRSTARIRTDAAGC
ncbi:MAG TPA: tyrosine-type recombinase/integrase [Mycobacterium sp.]|nr:tyrosine-type recombinase/integrase [Mycobacterium sp.]